MKNGYILLPRRMIVGCCSGSGAGDQGGENGSLVLPTRQARENEQKVVRRGRTSRASEVRAATRCYLVVSSGRPTFRRGRRKENSSSPLKEEKAKIQTRHQWKRRRWRWRSNRHATRRDRNKPADARGSPLGKGRLGGELYEKKGEGGTTNDGHKRKHERESACGRRTGIVRSQSKTRK